MSFDAPPPVPQHLLVVDDHEDARESLAAVLRASLEVEVDTAPDGAAGLERLLARPYSVVLTDLRMPRMDGMSLIREVTARELPVTIIVTTGTGSIPDAVAALQMGAYDFVTKPPDPEHLCLLVRRALQARELQDELAALRARTHGRTSFQDVLSNSPRMLEVFDLITHLANTSATVLVLGETGTGKELVARAIHRASAAVRPGPLVAVNCAAFPETLLETELFGHEKGAFTGAVGQRKGRFEQAHGGTLFLDEVGDIPLPMQVKLLRVLQERTIERVGGTEPIPVDVRVVAATHRALEKMVAGGTFREDLFYRLNVVRIELPALRERPEDVPLLTAHFCRKYARPGHPPADVSPEAMALLERFHWPGNVRQLENAVERASVTARNGLILPAHLPDDVARGPVGGEARFGALPVDMARPLPDQLAELTAQFEERYLRRALKRTRGHVGKCAKLSGLSRRSVTDKIAAYRIDKSEFKSG